MFLLWYAFEMRSFRDRYPPPWRPEQMTAGFRVVASNGMTLVYIYAEDNWATTNSLKMSWAEARALAVAIARLPDKDKRPGRRKPEDLR